MRETKPKDISEFLDRLTTVEQEFLWEHIAKIRELDKCEQKPAWSEDDKKMFVNIKACLRNANIDYSREIDWLKSLNPHPKNEWSEKDERIRKELITHCKNTRCVTEKGAERIAKWIDWFEKQGCQKSVDKEYTFKSIPRLLDMIEPSDRAKSYCKKLIDSLQTEGYFIDAKIVGECLKQMNGEKVAMAVMDIEKQGEKPLTVDIESMIEAYEQRLLSQGNAVRNSPIINMCVAAFKHGVENTLDELHLRQGEQDGRDSKNKELKKIEQKSTWSREDEQNLNAVLGFIDDEYLRRWLKDVIHTKYDKNIWSGEDENGLGDALWAIQQARTIAKDENDMGNLWYAEHWLKSLKPQNRWKPSDKQIKALEHFVRSIGESGYASPYDNSTKLLYSLLEQLKKLKEE